MASVGISSSKRAETAQSGLRPVNLNTDLAALADLIEMAFAATMDSNGRNAIREMRALSKMGMGRSILFGLNEMASGVSLGYVWVEDGKVIGNASIYPAARPAGAPRAWIIANVAVHPDYRGRGIAKALMHASLNAVRKQAGSASPNAILQVHEPNPAALTLYERLGFVTERRFTTWRLNSSDRLPAPRAADVYITRRRPDEWRAEYALAQQVRPDQQGGVGWLRPTVPGLFRRGWGTAFGDLFNMRSIERLVVREDERGTPQLRASLWIESGFAVSSTQLTLLCQPGFEATAGEALLHSAIRRFALRTALTIEHPADDEVVTAMLRRYGFTTARTLIQMRWEPASAPDVRN